MSVGAALTLTITSLAATLGETWSGILAVFPVFGVILSMFTHNTLGFAQVTILYQGMVQGLFYFVAYFTSLAMILPHTTIWLSCISSALIAVATQIIVQLISMHYSNLIKKYASGFDR
jgi:uncharacterized membrane protein (GlpM family)